MARIETLRRRKINCDFFRVHMPDGYADFAQCLHEAIASRATIGARNYQSEDGVWRIESLAQRASGHVSGVFVNLRTTADARVARVEAEGLAELDLGDGQSLAEFCCFIYHPQYQTLVVHRNKYAGGYARIEFYASQLIDCTEVKFGLIINQDALARLNRMEYKQKLEITISNPSNLNHVAGNESARSFAALAAGGDVELMNVTLSAGKRRTGISQRLVNAVTSLLSTDETQVKTARVRGRLDDDMVTIDLIKDRMQETVEVQLVGRRISLEEVIGALEQAYERRQGEIGRQFRQPQA